MKLTRIAITESIPIDLGSDVNFPGVAQGRGLSKQASLELGLQAGTPVGASLIDAYAGALGLLGCKTNSDIPVHQRLGLEYPF